MNLLAARHKVIILLIIYLLTFFFFLFWLLDTGYEGKIKACTNIKTEKNAEDIWGRVKKVSLVQAQG